jgi:hypothetical protein
MYAKCVSGEKLKRGGKEQHSKIGPVNNGAGRERRPRLITKTTRNRTANQFIVTMFPKTEGTLSSSLVSHF